MNKYLTELIGTFFLMLTFGMSVASGSDLAPLAIGSVLMVMVYMGAHISGAHYNPAVTLAVLIRGKISSSEAVRYMVFQLAGAILAALAVLWLADEAFVPAPGIGITTLQAFVAELLFTFALALTVLQTYYNDATAGNSYYGLATGFAIMVGFVAVGDVSGGVFNPAIGLGPILVGGMLGVSSFANILLYLIGPFAGGALAAVVYKRQTS
jgi:aquaporin Z